MKPWRQFSLGGSLAALCLAALCLGQPAGARAAELGPEAATELERLLAELNFDPGAIDGVIDARTRTAIALYQEFAALAVDGEPGPELLVELRQVVRAFAEINAAKAVAAEAAPEPEPEPEVAAQPEPAPQPEPEVAAQPEPEPEVAAQPEPEPEVAAQPEPEPQTEPEVAAQPEPEPEVTAQPEPEPQPEPEVAAQPEPEPKSGFDLDHMIARLVYKDGTGGAPAGAGPDRDLVLAVQRQLARIGLDPGPLDGQLGARTSEAIVVYQGVRGLPVDGRPSRALLDHLAREPDHPGRTGQDGGPSGGSGGGPGPDQTSRVATHGAIARLLGAADGEKFPTPAAGANVTALGASAPALAALDGYGAFKIAFAAAEVGDFARAIELYSRAIEGGDLALADLADAFYNRANARSYAKAYDFAIADYGAAIVNKPEFPGAYYNRGFAFEASGRHTRAVADFMKARALGLQRLGVRAPDAPPPRR